MHGIGPLSWGEILTILSIVAFIFGGIWRMLVKAKQLISDPLEKAIAQLTDSIARFETRSHDAHTTFDKRLDKHDVKLAEHDTEIGLLYGTVGLKRHKEEEE